MQLSSKDPKAAALAIVGDKNFTEATPADMQKLSVAIGVD